MLVITTLVKSREPADNNRVSIRGSDGSALFARCVYSAHCVYSIPPHLSKEHGTVANSSGIIVPKFIISRFNCN